jgi:hypothetical protein
VAETFQVGRRIGTDKGEAVMTIWKFILEVTDEQMIQVPPPFQPLTVQIQNGRPCLWALVGDREVIYPAPQITRRIWTVGTGHSCNHVKRDNYVGTYQLHGGELVFHVFAERDQ